MMRVRSVPSYLFAASRSGGQAYSGIVAGRGRARLTGAAADPVGAGRWVNPCKPLPARAAPDPVETTLAT